MMMIAVTFDQSQWAFADMGCMCIEELLERRNHRIGFFYLHAIYYGRLQDDDDDVTVPLLSVSNGRQNEENLPDCRIPIVSDREDHSSLLLVRWYEADLTQ
jgi:hypothetical protein